MSVLFDKRPGMQELMVRAMTGDGYSRLWDEEVTGLAMRLQDTGWKLPLAYEGGNWGAEKKPVCFGGDRDVFVLMEDREHRVSDGTSEGMMRAVMLRNSEVGARSWQMWAAYLRDICGNLILWGVTKEIAVRLRHVGQVGPRAAVEVSRVLEGFANESPREIEEKVKRLQATRIAVSVEEVVKRVREKVDIPQKRIKAAIELAEASGVDGDPLSAWGLTQGLTRLSQSAPFTDARVDQDQLAAKVLAAQWA